MPWKLNRSSKQIQTSKHATTWRLERKQHRTDFNIYNRGLMNRVFTWRKKSTMLILVKPTSQTRCKNVTFSWSNDVANLTL